MNLAKRACRFGAVSALGLIAALAPAGAQDISESHTRAARQAISAIDATDQYDEVLPQAARALKGELIRKNPNLVDVINATVDEETLALVSRRADLEREAALAYARVFSEDELGAIAEFYESPAGQKLIEDGPIVTREVTEAAEIWQRGIARDLAQNVGEKIEAEAGESIDVEPPETTLEPGADTPATSGEASDGSPDMSVDTPDITVE